MAKKKEPEPKTVLERVYTIPLRRQTLKVPSFKKANKAAKTVREFISKHMKSDNVKIGKYLNLNIWKHGAKNPPGKVKVNAVKDEKGKVVVEIVGAPKPKVDEKKKPAVKGAEKKETKAEEKRPEEEKKEDKAKESEKIEKQEIKDLKKELPKQQAPKMPAKPNVPQQRPTAPKSQ